MTARRDYADEGAPNLGEAAAHRDRDQRSLDRQKVELLIKNIADILSSEVVLYCRLDGERAPEVVCSWGVRKGYEPPARPHRGGFVGRALWGERATLEPLHPDLDASLIAAAAGHVTYAAAAPVRLASETAGALIATFTTPPADGGLALWGIESCAALLALSIHRAGPLNTLLWAASLDTLTGCLNYAGTRYELDREINRSTRGGLSLSICFLDLDNFKRINDEHGHLRGNDVLARAARGLHGCVRSCDTVGRFGGDEFIAIFPDTDEADAVELAARMQATIAPAAPDEHDLSASVGVAQWRAGDTADTLLARADQALMRAKASRASANAA